MKKLLIIICLAAATARIITPMAWETTARADLRAALPTTAAAQSAEERALLCEIQAPPDAQLSH